VAGSEFAPYEVSVTFDEAGITEAACGCPYEWDGWCKHIVATLLASIYVRPQGSGPEALLHLRVIAATGRVADPACQVACHLFVAGV
jgi:uncharacterized Zn finger protein